jgi:hypothetical protein
VSRKKQEVKIAVIDFETDPFLFGRVPKPFAAGFFDGENYVEFWGDDCAQYLVDYISALETKHIIYAHNGGKFDFFFLLEWLQNPLKLINGRITKAGFIGGHEIRDSYAIIPIPLKAYQKEDIDYGCFERHKREAHKSDILFYLAKDCEYLYSLVNAFVERFGAKLTIGGTAMGKLREIHKFPTGDETHDSKFRPFYYGGRVQCFEAGILKGAFKIFDVNSMYPDRMKNCVHPIGRGYACPTNPRLTNSGKLKGFGNRPYFAEVIAINRGAFPVRLKSGLSFEQKEGRFFTTSHEIETALQYGLCDIKDIIAAYVPKQLISFGDYVDIYSAEKIAAKKEGDKVGEIFAKLLLNSPYGKLAQNPENYYDYRIIKDISELTRDEWREWDLFEAHGEYQIWRKKSDAKSYFDVAAAASITGASRAKLLAGLALSKRPIYCDTDSIICEEFYGETDISKLGAWKCEGEADSVAIAGKKLYAAFDGEKCIKLASKGARLQPSDVVSLCKGKTVSWNNSAPSFSLSHAPNFVSRNLVKRIDTAQKFGV